MFSEGDNFLSLMKHQFPVTLKSFENVNVIVPAGFKIGNTKLSQAMNFMVKSTNGNQVTLIAAPPLVTPQDTEWDEDGERDNTDDNLPDKMEFTLSKEEFQKLLSPSNPPAQPQM